MLGAAASGILGVLGAYLFLELWRADLSVPFRYYQIDDTKFYLALVKDILEHGSYQHNPSLAAPFGAVLYDFPQSADNLNLGLIRVIGFFSSDFALVTNLFFLLTFPLTAWAAYYALRRLDVGPAIATVCAVLFALLPYHFYRHESQVLLSAYYAVPLGGLLFLSLFAERPLLRRRGTGHPALRWASRRSLATIASCVVIGSTGLYYATFTILLLLVGTAVVLVAGGGRRRAAAGGVTCAVICLTLIVNLSPSLLYTARHGADPQIARAPVESEQLGLRVSSLVLPVRAHRLPALSGVNLKYAAETSPGYCESCNETLGAVGAVGFVLLCLVGLAACAGTAWAPAESRRLEWQRPLRPAALGVAIALAIGSVGGVSALIAFAVTPDVRAWNRISLFIAFFSLLAVAVLLDRAGRRLRGGPGGGRGRAWLTALLLGVVLVLGALDETSTFFVVNYAASAREYRGDQAFGRLIQARLPPGSNVLELPYVPFPEGYHVPGQPPPSAFGTSYDLLRPYLNTHGLHWSFGAMKGRPADWQGAMAAKRLDVVVAGAAAAGFAAIYVDPKGYDPATALRVRAGLTALLGAGPLVSARQDAWLFDLGPYLRAIRRRAAPGVLAAAREATLHPLRTICGSTPADLILENPTPAPRPATLTASLSAPLPGGATLLISFPDGTGVQRRLASAPVALHRHVVVAPGRSEVRFGLAGLPPFGSGPSMLPFLVSSPTLTDAAYAPLLSGPPAARSSLPLGGLVGPTCNDLYLASAGSHYPSAFPRRPAGRASRRPF
ncbi:MAG: hypothetical protein QOF77_532 [Solirubrobacteraceae bacterium]|nr:hypothetical protein [Solirubrobacteraceae bacterium]